LEKYERISLNGLLDGNTDKREYLSWQIAHQVVEIAKREGKGDSGGEFGEDPKR
jgi:hypothetical protein